VAIVTREQQQVATLRQQLWQAGFRPVPCLTGERIPIGRDWPERARQDPPECLKFDPVPHALNTGILADALRLIDLDVDDAGLAETVADLVFQMLGEAPTRFRRNSPRRCIAYRAARGEPPKRSITGPHGKVEILGRGQQALAFGRHPSGAELEWTEAPGAIGVSDLPAVREDQISALLAALAPLIGASPPKTSDSEDGEHIPGEPQADIERIAEAMAQIPNDQAPDWEWWNKFGMALWAATAGSAEGRQLWHEWSAKNASYNQAEAERRWAHFFRSPPTELGAGTIFRAAQEAEQARMDGWFDRGPSAKQQPENDPWAQTTQARPEPPDLSVIHINRRPPSAFPLDAFSERWAAWITTTAAAACCPVDYVAAPLLATASALIGNARWAEGTPGWSEPPVLWTASVGDSGDGKSPGGDVILGRVVPEIERRMVGDFPERHRDWLTNAEIAKAKEAAWSAAVAAAQKKGGTPPLRPSDLDPGPEPQMPRLRQSDVTIEKVAQLLAQSAPKGLLCTRDELAGFLLGMNTYHDAARAFWLEAYGGRPYRVERIRLAEPLLIPHNTCAWYGTIQPERLAELLATPDDGLLSRFIMFWPDPVPFRQPSQASDVSFAVNSLDRLRALEMYPSDGRLHPIQMPLVRPAWPRLIEFANAMQSEKEMTTGLLKSAYGKARGLALRLSLIFELLRWAGEEPDIANPGPPGVISASAFADACRLVAGYILPMAARVYGDAATAIPERNAAMLARWIIRVSPRPSEVHVRTMQRKVRLAGLSTADDIHAACQVLTEAGWLLPGTRSGGKARLRTAYPINPVLWETWDAR
jgi:hypothetical protein